LCSKIKNKKWKVIKKVQKKKRKIAIIKALQKITKNPKKKEVLKEDLIKL